jgi:hypothetical protein
MWLRVLYIGFEACYYLLSLLLCQNSIYAQIYACFMILLLSSHMYVLIFKSCSSLTIICTTIGLYAKSFDN